MEWYPGKQFSLCTQGRAYRPGRKVTQTENLEDRSQRYFWANMFLTNHGTMHKSHIFECKEEELTWVYHYTDIMLTLPIGHPQHNNISFISNQNERYVKKKTIETIVATISTTKNQTSRMYVL